MDFSITGLQFGLGTLLLAVFVIGVIVFVRQYLTSKNISKDEKASTKKYAEVDVFKSSGTFWRLGLACAVGFTILAFSWTTYQKTVDYDLGLLTLEDDDLITPPITTTPPPPPPPLPPPTMVEVVEDTPEEPPIFVDQTVTKNIDNSAAKPKKKKPRPKIKRTKPPIKKKKEEIEKIHAFVEEMPRFPGCEDISGNSDAKKSCADKKMLAFIYNNIKYPTIARENGVEGTVVVSFVVEKDGSITDIKILRDPGAGVGEEAARIVEKMQSLPQKWKPGKQGNDNVRVQFNLPIRFKLE